MNAGLKQETGTTTAQLTNQLDQLEEQFNKDVIGKKGILTKEAVKSGSACLLEAATQASATTSMPSSQDSIDHRQTDESGQSMDAMPD